jgi:hydroxyethylthiazole kinase
MENFALPRNIIATVRRTRPLVYHLTNFVTVNDCANLTLAIGASPVMTLGAGEAAEMAGFASALVLNMGTPDEQSIASMMAAGKVARERGIPIVFDPVGAGVTAYRQALARRIMEEIGPGIVKGNLGEIRWLAGLHAAMRGVDSLDLEGAAVACRTLARRYSCVAFATGESDCVSDGADTWMSSGGCALLGHLCGTGCMTASLCASLAATGERPVAAALAASVSMKRAGEMAAVKCGSAAGTTIPSGAGSRGPVGLGSFRQALLDAVCALQDSDLDPGSRIRHVAA